MFYLIIVVLIGGIVVFLLQDPKIRANINMMLGNNYSRLINILILGNAKEKIGDAAEKVQDKANEAKDSVKAKAKSLCD